MHLDVDDHPWDTYLESPPEVAEGVDQVFDWLEQDPVNPHARRHAFSNGLWAVVADISGETWVLLWEADDDCAVVRHIGLDSFGLT